MSPRNAIAIFRGLLVAIAFIAWSPIANAIENKDYCLPSGKVVLFLLDITTPYDQTDRDAIVRATDKLLADIRGGDRIVVKTIGDNYTRSERLIERCIPQCAAGGSALDRLMKCSDGVLRTDTQRVNLAIISALKERLKQFQELKSSDVLRTIYNSVKEERRANQGLDLHIYSDLIENSDYFSNRYLFSYTLDVLVSGVKHYKLLSALEGSDVRVSGVGRGDSKERRQLSIVQLNKLTEFWTAYFRESGARSITIRQNAE